MTDLHRFCPVSKVVRNSSTLIEEALKRHAILSACRWILAGNTVATLSTIVGVRVSSRLTFTQPGRMN
jgi:hypothetical protein